MRGLGHSLERQLAVDLLDGALDVRLHPLDTALGGRGEVRDVSLPAGCPLGGLMSETLLGAGGHEVEGGEGHGACDAVGGDLGGLCGGDADGHVEE